LCGEVLDGLVEFDPGAALWGSAKGSIRPRVAQAEAVETVSAADECGIDGEEQHARGREQRREGAREVVGSHAGADGGGERAEGGLGDLRDERASSFRMQVRDEGRSIR
jgi:hypothetical protein